MNHEKVIILHFMVAKTVQKRFSSFSLCQILFLVSPDKINLAGWRATIMNEVFLIESFFLWESDFIGSKATIFSTNTQYSWNFLDVRLSSKITCESCSVVERKTRPNYNSSERQKY